jgi:aryl-alcohol dehydrogenase-like predicted oxidoreductase
MQTTELDRVRPELVSLGKTGIITSRMGLGLAALGRPGYMTLHHRRDLEGLYEPAAMERRAQTVLDAAYAHGIHYVDVARSYGRGEAFAASWLAQRHLHRDAVVVASKWGYTYTADWRVDADSHEVKDHSLSALQRQLRETHAVLGAHLAIYQIHSVTVESIVLRDAAVIDALARLRATGVRVGLTASGDRQDEVIRAALNVRRDGEHVFDIVQATWNLLERGAESALREAHEAGVAVVVKEALANGRLVGFSVDHRFAGRLQRLRALAGELNATTDAVAIAAALARPWADVVLSGAATVPHLESNLGALAITWDAALDAELEPLGMPSAEYWRMRRGFTWN